MDKGSWGLVKRPQRVFSFFESKLCKKIYIQLTLSMPLAIMKQLAGLGGKPVKTLWTLFFFAVMFCSSYAKAENLLDGADLGYGEYLSGECVTCHSKDGVDKGIPAINGLDAEVFASIMYAYKTGEMDHPVMMMVAGRLDAEQIASLAVYFAATSGGK